LVSHDIIINIYQLRILEKISSQKKKLKSKASSLEQTKGRKYLPPYSILLICFQGHTTTVIISGNIATLLREREQRRLG